MKTPKNKIWLSSPHMGENELKYVSEAFESNWVAPLGPNLDKFERDIESFLQYGHIAALSSGTAALHLALQLLGVGPGDYVLCQSLTFIASANPIVYVGAKPIFIDSENDTWNMCPNTLEKAIVDLEKSGQLSKLKAIISVNLYGMPAKYNDIIRISEKYNIPLIEDAAESLGSKYSNNMAGTFGRLGILSFNGNKIITTSGGGAIWSPDCTLINKAKYLSTQAREDAPHYEHTEIGFNYRMSNLLAGVGRGQMEVLSSRIESRRNLNRWYRSFLEDLPGLVFQSEPSSEYFSNYWITAIVLDEEISGCSNEQLRIALEKENIEARPLWKPMHLQPVFKDERYYGGRVSENLFSRGLCLPSGSNMSSFDRDRVKSGLQKALINSL